MLSRSTWLHLRIPFSYFLMPAYLFALSISPNLSERNLLWSFVIIHLLLYPASNGYNSYFDKDEKSIGGLKNPPPVTRGLYFTSLLLDVIAIALGFIQISMEFAILLLVYGLVSKAYSHPSIRLKKYPIGGWLTVVIFQGVFTFMMCYAGINGFAFGNLFREKVLIGGALVSLLLFASYPLTQVYQHSEDARRGDKTLSMLLGVRGTFYFAMTFFAVAAAGFMLFFNTYFEHRWAISFLVILLPVMMYFIAWFVRIVRDERNATYSSAMWLNFISATCLNGFFIEFFLETSHILQL
jgi:1,4-dihydroxy-2-naphthoate octaprenyltransferase